MRSCYSAAPAGQAATATTTKSSAALVAQHRRRSIACRAASTSSSSRPIDTHDEGDDSVLRNRRAMLAQGAGLAAAALAFAPLSAFADDEIVDAAAPVVAPAPAPAAAPAAPAALDVEVSVAGEQACSMHTNNARRRAP